MERVFQYPISQTDAGKDIRSFLRAQGYSRHILASIKPVRDAVLVNGKHELLRYMLQEGDLLEIRVRDGESSPNVIPAPVPFSIVYEDDDLLIIDKPANVAIHPAVGHPANTLANGLAWYFEKQRIPFVFRCINRLDRDTTGLLIVAKNLVSSSILETALQKHEIRRTYLALAEGDLPESGMIDLPIGRKDGSLIERCVDREHGDRAVTHFQKIRPASEDLLEGDVKRGRFLAIDSESQSLEPLPERPAEASRRKGGLPLPDYSVLEIWLETGRTHQIRVHMAAEGHPLLGDSLYNPRWISQFEKGVPKPDAVLPYGLSRQALHSWKLDLTHPISRKPLHFEAPVPDDIAACL